MVIEPKLYLHEMYYRGVFGKENIGHCITCGLPFIFEELSYHNQCCQNNEGHESQLKTQQSISH